MDGQTDGHLTMASTTL